MTSYRVSLRYPNGRFHETELVTNVEPTPGLEFEMYGRRWRTVGMLPADRISREPRIECVAITSLHEQVPGV